MLGMSSQKTRQIGRVVVAYLLVFSVFMLDVGWLQFGDFSAALPRAEALTGDYSIFKETTGTETVTATPLNITWDTPVVESGNITLAGNDSSIDLAEGGKYLVLYNAWAQKGTSTGADRRSFETYLTLNGSGIEYGRGGGYFRDASGEDLEAYAAGGAIIDASAGDDLNVVIRRDETNSTVGSNIRPNTNGVSVLKLNDSFDYLRIHQSTDSSDISGNTSFTDVVFDTAEEVDTGSFAYTASSTATDVTLKGAVGKKFLVTANVRLYDSSGNSNRQNYEMRLALDGSEVSGTKSTAYLRGDAANAAGPGGAFTGTLVYTGIIEKTSASDQIFTIQVRRESVTGVTTEIVADETALSMMALPASAQFISLTSTGASQTLTSARSTLNWNDQLSISSDTYTHSTTTNNSRIAVDTAGDYLFFSTVYTSRTSGTDRNVPRIEWQIDGSTVVDYGGHGSFNRGDQGADDAFTSGSSGGVLLNGLTGGQYIEVLQSDESGGTPNAVFPAGQIALQAIDLASLAQIDVTASDLSEQVETVNPSTSNFYIGNTFVINENSSARNVTNLIFTESGTVDAANDIDNIKLFYDLDTSLPYDCASESYSGGESQFGSTDTDGFTAANGTVSFTGSVSISTTQAFCGYIVLDTLSGVNDSETLNISIADPTNDIVVTGGASIGPAAAVGNSTLTTVVDPELTQYGYHWRNDDGDETGATSVTGGIPNSPALSFSSTTPQRLRLGVYAPGTGSDTVNLRLEFAEKAGTCALATGWADVDGADDDWNLFDSSNITNGANTTNIATSSGGVGDPALVFLTPNGGLLDTSSETGALEITYGDFEQIGEYGTTTVTNGASTTINLIGTYIEPVVVASVRYNRSTDVFRSPRVTAKTSTSFDLLTDNNDSSVTGSTVVDYLVMEAGTWNIQDGAGTRLVIATSTKNISEVNGDSDADDLGEYDTSNGDQFNWPTSFSGAPAVIATISSYNSPDWMMAHVSDGVSRGTPPTNTSAGVYIGRSHEAIGAYTEDIDVIAFEQGHGSHNGDDFDVVVSPDDIINSTPGTVTFFSSFSSAPQVTVLMQGAEQGGNGATVLRHTGTAITASGVSAAYDEDGATTGDRAHTWEPVAAISFQEPVGEFLGDTITNDNWVEVEYAIQATATTTEGVAYCFRLTDAGTPLRNYAVYPEATLNADVTVSATGTQATSVAAGDVDTHVGGTLVVADNVATRTVSSVTIAETGSIDAAVGLDNIALYYELDTSAPYNCQSESYAGTELQFGVTDTDGFSSANGTSTFTDSVLIATTSTLCLYPVFDVTTSAANGETIDIEITNPSADVTVSSGSVGPGSAIAITGSTTVAAAALVQTGYHFRSNNGTEATASSSVGSENTPIIDVIPGAIQRIRVAVSNAGTATSSAQQFRIEYGTKVTTCEDVAGWQDVTTGVAFTMASSSNLVEGDDTIDLSLSLGGITNPNSVFETPNGGQRELASQTGSITLGPPDFVELEYAVESTDQAAFETTYCFRVTNAGTPLPTYTRYPELTTRQLQDFSIQQGTVQISGTSTTLVAGSNYTAPRSSSTAFIRITNSQLTGGGNDTGGGTFAADDVTAYIENGENIMESITIARPETAGNTTRVNWEIIEYIGLDAADNEMIVRSQNTVAYTPTGLFATGTPTSVVDDTDVVVFITGQINPATSTAGSDSQYNDGLSTAAWSSTSSVPVFQRGDADSLRAGVSYAVVEFTGANWKIQRVEHNYIAANDTEIEPITSVNSPTRAFVHAQKRVGGGEAGLNEYGHQVWLSSIGAISFFLQGPLDAVDTPSLHYSVAWVIENTQTGDGAMAVYRSDDQLDNNETVEPRADTILIEGTLSNVTNASIWVTNESTGAGTAFPRPILAPRIISTTEYELWRSDTGQFQTFRTAVVEWPVAELSVRQNYYRLYADNDELDPTDPWPAGAADLGENEAMTDLDEPLGQGERTRLRMSLFINNATLVQNSQTFKLQYGRRVSSCSAISSWNDVGGIGSGAIWRGYNGSPVDGTELATSTPAPGRLNLSVSDVAGTYEEANNSALNPHTVDIGEDVEYDWVVENNGALQKSSYCFRMIESDGTELTGYDNYPTVRTSGYTPISSDWRWFDDETNETPVTAVAATNTAPIDVTVGEILKLRVAVAEIEGAAGAGIKFNLQYSEYSDFIDGGTTLTATTSCTGGKLWCYADGVDDDNDVITTPVLGGIDSCVGGVGDGCGTHNEAEGLTGPFTHAAFAVTEHEFTLQHDGARANAVYYFRLVDATNGVEVLASSTYPSVVTEGATLSFTIDGVASSTITEGVTTDVDTEPTAVSFGTVTVDDQIEAAHRLTVSSNATQGYQMLLLFDQSLTNTYGTEVAGITGTNASPVGWSSGCSGSAAGCFGYHAGDDILADGSTRFSPSDSYAAPEPGPVEIMHSTIPVTNEVHDIVFKLQVRELQPAGDYTAGVTYVAVPVF